jgi:hypothetical protein
MKIKLYILSLIFVTTDVFSQITVTENDVINIGDNIYEALDSVSGSTIQIGSAGANQTWDFSNLQQNEVNIIAHVDPISTAFGFMHPTSNICAKDDSENIYFKKSSTAIEIVGFDDQSLVNPILALPLPLTYPMQVSTGPVLALSELESNAFLPDSLAPLISFGAAHVIDSINVQVTLESSYNVDGWGDVIIPMGTFPALRLYVSATNTQSVLFYCTDTILGIASGWYPAPQQLFPTDTETDYFYQWWSNDPNVKMGLVNIDVDEYGYNNGEIQFLTNNVTSITQKDDLQVRIFPVPATYSLTIESEENIITNLTLRDNNGQLILEDKFNTRTSLSLDGFAKGIYYLTLRTDDRELTKKVVVE